MYKGIICKIENIRNHPNADRLNIGNALGFNVIIGKDIEEGTLGVFFQSDGQLSEEFVRANNLYSNKEYNKDPEAKGGFFANNRRVRAINLRGEKSEGYWTTLNCFDYISTDLSFNEDEEIDVLNGNHICNKYITEATRKAINRNKNKTNKKKVKGKKFVDFKEHFDTKHLQKCIKGIPKSSIVTITCKVHGTSARTGKLKEKLYLNRFKRWWNRHFSNKFTEYKYQYVSGSRRVVLNTEQEDNGYYKNTNFRNKYHNLFKDNELLQPNETAYYEIVGYDENGKTIMSSQGIKDKNMKKKYGNQMVYSYGCKPKQNAIYLYRMTRTLDDGSVHEIPWFQLVKRCQEMNDKLYESNIKIGLVPLLDQFIYCGDQDKLLKTCEKLSEGPSTLDSSHIREGVVIRVEHPELETFYKYKSFDFVLLEDRHKEKEGVVDEEESS